MVRGFAQYEELVVSMLPGNLLMAYSDGLGEDLAWAQSFRRILANSGALELREMARRLMALAHERIDDQTCCVTHACSTHQGRIEIALEFEWNIGEFGNR